MKNIFSDAETFKEALKAEVSARFGRDFEDAYPEERYLALGTLIRDQLGYSWKVNVIKFSNCQPLARQFSVRSEAFCISLIFWPFSKWQWFSYTSSSFRKSF